MVLVAAAVAYALALIVMNVVNKIGRGMSLAVFFILWLILAAGIYVIIRVCL